jgi:hypothetical protein
MKSFREYIAEAELFEDIPAAGDVFEIEIAREEIVLESVVVGYMDDGIIVEADDTMMRILEHVGYLTENPTNMPPATDTTSPISGRNRRAQDAFKDLDNTDPASQQDLDNFRSRVKSGSAGKPTKLQNMNPLDREQWEREKQQHGIQNEAEYQGRNVPLGKPMAGDVKKSKVYVKNAKGNVVKVNFGDPNMKIKKSNPKRRKSFRARHNCANPGPRTSARYWSCRAW